MISPNLAAESTFTGSGASTSKCRRKMSLAAGILKTTTHRVGDLELKKPPILLKDGDHIGVLVNGNAVDDLQTDADKLAAAEFNVLKEAEQRRKAEEQANKRFANDNIGIRINFEDEEERALALAIEESRRDAEAAGIEIS